MFDTNISLDQYQGVDGFGPPVSAENLAALNKALLTGYDIANQTGGAALRPESLEASLKVVTHSARHLALWRKWPKSPAFSTTEEFNRLQSYGARMGGFLREGELPQESVSSYSREVAKVKFLGATRGVSLQMSMVNPAHGDVIAQENHNGILYLLTQANIAGYRGDSSLAAPGNTGEEFDGLDRLIDPLNIIDASGSALSEPMLQDTSDLIASSYGFATDVFAGVKPLSDLVKSFYARERVMLPAPVGGQVGHSISTVATQNGILQLNSDVFLQAAINPSDSAQSAKAPTAPATLVLGTSGVDGEFAKAQGAGVKADYGYCVTAGNRYGESAPVYAAAGNVTMDLTVPGSPHVDLTVTNGVQGQYTVEYYAIYRSRPLAFGAPALIGGNESKLSLIARIPVTTAASGGVNNYDDLNIQMPFTNTVYVGQLTPDVLTFRQLAPLMRLDLAVIAAARQWMILLFGTPILFAPKKWAKIINVGSPR